MITFICVCDITFSQSTHQWTFTDGPYYARTILDISVGMNEHSPVVYAVNFDGKSVIKSIDGCNSWSTILSDPFPLCVAANPNNPDIVYVSTDYGVKKSTDGGTSWDLVLPNKHFRKITVSFSNPNFIVAAINEPDEFGIYFSSDAGTSWVIGGLGINKPFVVSDIIIDKFIPSRIYISGFGQSFSQDLYGSIWRSDDAGENFSEILNNVREFEIGAITISPSDNNIIYAGTKSEYLYGFPSFEIGKQLKPTLPCLYKSTNKGDTWEVINTFEHYSSDIVISPQDENVIIVCDEKGIYRTTDAGNHWQDIGIGLGGKYALSLNIAEYNGNNVLIAGTQKALYKSYDYGSNWFGASKGIFVLPTQFVDVYNGTIISGTSTVTFDGNVELPYGLINKKNNIEGEKTIFESMSLAGNNEYEIRSVCQSPFDPQKIVAGYEIIDGENKNPNFFLSNTGGKNWTIPYPQAPYDINTSGPEEKNISISFDPQDYQKMMVAFNHSLCPPVLVCDESNIIPGQLTTSNDAGFSWLLPTDINFTDYWIQSSIIYYNHENEKFICVAGRDVYTQSVVFYQSSDDGHTWSDNTGSLHGTNVSSISEVQGNSHILYVSTDDGIFKSINNSQTWEQIASFPNISNVLVHPYNSNVVYVAWNETSIDGGHIYKSTDAGQNWSEFSAGIPENVKVNQLSFDKRTFNSLYLATDAGIYTIPHIWKGEISTDNVDWTADQTYYCEGTVSVLKGTTLTIQPGTKVKFYYGSKLKINGKLIAIGTENNSITFSTADGSPWYGIEFDGSEGNIINNSTISNAWYAITAPFCTGLVFQNNLIIDPDIGVHIITNANSELPSRTVVKGNTFNSVNTVGILIDSHVGDVTIQDNTIVGVNDGDIGMLFIESSPSFIINNKLHNFFDGGIVCYSSSPSLVDGIYGGRNCSYNNGIGVLADNNSFPILGITEGEPFPGLNSVYNNTEYQIVVKNTSTVFAQEDYFRINGPNENDFFVDATSRLFTDHALESNPNDCESAGSKLISNHLVFKKYRVHSKINSVNDGPLSNYHRDIKFKQAVKMRQLGNYIGAINILKTIINTSQDNDFIY